MPYGSLTELMAKIRNTRFSNIMRKKEAETDPNQQIPNISVHGPFSYNRDETPPGHALCLRPQLELRAALRTALPASPARRSSRSTASIIDVEHAGLADRPSGA